jgi:hypothetical protein
MSEQPPPEEEHPVSEEPEPKLYLGCDPSSAPMET